MNIWETIVVILKEMSSMSDLGLLFIAMYGLHSWRREYVYKRRVELAEEILIMFYKMKETISWIRSPVLLDYEESELEQQLKTASSDNKKCPIYYLAPKLRIQKAKDLISSFSAMKYIAMIKLDAKLLDKFNEINEILHQISVNSLWLFRDYRSVSLVEVRKAEQVIWETPTKREVDEISSQIIRNIEQVEKICKKYI